MSPAPKGHPLWGNPLNPKKFKSPKELWEKACEYFKWCNENQWVKKEILRGSDGTGKLMDVPVGRPYTLQALCRFLNIERQTFINYGKAEGYETFFEVVKAIREIIESNQMEGAILGAYKENIISRMLGLAEKVDMGLEDKRKSVDDLFPPDEEIEAE